ncbi:MAG: hypothetical protein IJ353_06355 [Lachnospiraceae bacterium]|nr:hypothetical protein [Lachnospiraceae bacterium]
MRKGSITVFLSLVLVLLFSFLLTTLEAARIRGATAYVSMITDLAGDSVLASYYYPLFENYRIFGIDVGNEEGYFSQGKPAEDIKENLSFGLSGVSGGLFDFRETGVERLSCDTLLAKDCEAFYSQIKRQVVLDGLSLGLSELFSEEQFTEAGVVGEIYREQEEALAVTATVTTELLKLMELTDGIRMGDNGIAFDKNGKMQVYNSFLKKPVAMTQTELQERFDNEEVYTALSGSFYRADTAAGQVSDLLYEVLWLDSRISSSEYAIGEYNTRLQELKKEYKAEKKRLEKEKDTDETKLLELEKEMEETEELTAAEESALSGYESQRSSVLSSAKVQYGELKDVLDSVQNVLEDALKVTERLEKKQAVAKVAVEAYEVFLEGLKEKLSGELYEVFFKELEKMKIYAGLDERGFSISLITQTLQSNKDLLQEISLPRFSASDLSGMRTVVSSVSRRMEEYCVDGLWFSYGEIVVAEQTFQNVTGFLSELLTTGILSLVGISEEEVSERSLSGKDLPSAGLEEESLWEELTACMEEVQALFQSGGIKEVLLAAGNSMLNGTALELYSMKYFHRYGEASPYTRLNYEREYLIFGKEGDKTNLLSMVLYLVAIRALFNMVMILKQPDRVVQLETLSAGVAGFTGMPVLAAVVKYSVLLLWSVEEALVDANALLQGKRIAVVGPGRVSFGELFLMNKAAIERKADLCPDGVGAAYSDYLALVSLTRRTKDKTYRALDLIQENIRFRYRDSFRIRNLVTGLSFQTATKLKPVFDVGFFPVQVYEMKKEKEVSYQ